MPLTLGAAVGILIQSLVDDNPLKPGERRAIIEVLPPECRFIREDGSLPPLETLQAVMDWKELRDASRS